MAASGGWACVWVTGASSGIGRSIAVKLAKEGVKVAVSARSADELAALAASVPNIHPFPLDVADRDAVATTEAMIREKLGPIDLVIANAGVWHPERFKRLQLDQFEQAIRVNQLGTIYTLKSALPAMIARGSGHLAIVASIAGYRGLPLSSSYSPTKAALISLAETLRLELQPEGLTVSIVNPGFVETPMTSVNKFPMPFLMGVEDAADRIIRGLKRKRYEIAFPWQMVTLMYLARVIRNEAYFRFSRWFAMPTVNGAHEDKG